MALEWLKAILGEGYTDTVDAAISAGAKNNVAAIAVKREAAEKGITLF